MNFIRTVALSALIVTTAAITAQAQVNIMPGGPKDIVRDILFNPRDYIYTGYEPDYKDLSRKEIREYNRNFALCEQIMDTVSCSFCGAPAPGTLIEDAVISAMAQVRNNYCEAENWQAQGCSEISIYINGVYQGLEVPVDNISCM